MFFSFLFRFVLFPGNLAQLSARGGSLCALPRACHKQAREVGCPSEAGSQLPDYEHRNRNHAHQLIYRSHR